MAHSEHLAECFAPLARSDARLLILGSMPGLASLGAGQYYAHPQNRFWPFMGELVGAAPRLPYPQRCTRLIDARIALWDVLARCEREGSLDSAIRAHSAQANDFNGFLAAHPAVRYVAFNGAKAQSTFARLVQPTLRHAGLEFRRLPSTSPANASLRPADKLAAWRDGLRAAGIAMHR